jgi:hypothetical protein
MAYQRGISENKAKIISGVMAAASEGNKRISESNNRKGIGGMANGEKA